MVMRAFTALDLQQKTGDVQRAASAAPVVITSYGRPRAVMMSVDEFTRLKRLAAEPLPAAVTSRPVARRGLPADPLGYDTSDLRRCALAMAADDRAGRHEAAIRAEIAAVEKRFGMRP